MVREFKIVAGGKCPICRGLVNMRIHQYCILDLDDMIRRGQAELVNWTDPLPGEFSFLRDALYHQLRRNEVCISQSAGTQS